MLDANMTQVGVAGILTLMLLDKVLPYVTKQRNGDNSGGKPVDFWKTEINKAVHSAMGTQTMQVTAAIKDLQNTETKVHESVIELVVLARQANERAIHNKS